MNCEICGKGPSEQGGGVSIYRANPVGEVPAVWRCDEHLTTTSMANKVETAWLDEALWPKRETLEQERERVFGGCGGKCGEAPCIAYNEEKKRRKAAKARKHE